MVVGGVRGANNAVCGAYVRPDLAPNTPVSNHKSYVMTCTNASGLYSSLDRKATSALAL